MCLNFHQILYHGYINSYPLPRLPAFPIVITASAAATPLRQRRFRLATTPLLTWHPATPPAPNTPPPPPPPVRQSTPTLRLLWSRSSAPVVRRRAAVSLAANPALVWLHKRSPLSSAWQQRQHSSKLSRTHYPRAHVICRTRLPSMASCAGRRNPWVALTSASLLWPLTLDRRQPRRWTRCCRPRNEA